MNILLGDNNIIIYDYELKKLSFYNLFLKKKNDCSANYHKNFIFKTIDSRSDQQIKKVKLTLLLS